MTHINTLYRVLAPPIQQRHRTVQFESFMSDMTHPYVRHDSSVRVTWIPHM